MIDGHILYLLRLVLNEEEILQVTERLATPQYGELITKLLEVASASYNAGFDNGWGTYATRWEE